ncbi:MAG TPA: histidine kinase [Gaiellales bacterium]|jgi:signal transduction histidine kinase|nr:histidine kinase [Gaiellales bacterium]
MSSSTDRRWLEITGLAALGGAAGLVVALAGAPAAAQAVVVAVAVVASALLVGRRPRTEPQPPAEQGALFDHMLKAIDTERATLAHSLHDGPQQTMTAVRLMCDVVRDAVARGDDHRAGEVLDRLERLASDAADDLRRTVARLHPVVMQQQGLVQALGSLAETVHEEYGVATAFRKPDADWSAETERDTAIFQIAREAAVNAARHGRPPVTISLDRTPGDIHLQVEDRGDGLGAGNGRGAQEGIGIRMMRERAARLGAVLTLESAPGARTVVSLHVPDER